MGHYWHHHCASADVISLLTFILIALHSIRAARAYSCRPEQAILMGPRVEARWPHVSAVAVSI